jgi:hypothetical protein
VLYILGGLGIALMIAAQPAVPDSTLQQILRGIVQSEAERDTRVLEYTRIQHYRATSSRFDESAEMVVRMHYDHERGKSYETLSRSGSASVQTRVFEKLLRMEIESAADSDRETTLFTASHYRFRALGLETVNGKNCYVLELDPLQADKRLFSGKVWVDANEHAVVRVEGRPSTSVSFLVGRPSVIQEFGKFGDFWFATMRDSVANSFVLGTCQLRIDYADYKVIAR